MTRWGMVVDLARCVGCQTCTIACKMENGLPPALLWRTVLDVESGSYPDVNRAFFPLTCMHCADPPCHDACPTTATRVREDGIVWIVNDLCIGCGSCVVACPYEARHLLPAERYYFGAPTPPEEATYDPSRVGICTKCHFCFHKFDGSADGARPGEDPRLTPACSSSCIANAILFGDLDDPQSRVSRLVAEDGRPTRVLEQLGTDPSVVYLHAPRLDPRPPRLQHTWHRLAVSNFFCGPAGTALYLLAILFGWAVGDSGPLLDLADPLASLAGLSPGAWTLTQWAGLLGPVLMGVGLLSVGAEAGRPLRGFNVLRNVSRSWMSRESAFALGFIALGLLDTLLWANPLVQGVAGLCGLGVILAQGLILSKAKGVPAWNMPLLPVYFLSSGLLSGSGALLVLAWAAGPVPAGALGAMLALAMILTLADLALWQRYLAARRESATFAHSVQVLRSGPVRAGVVLLGHALPAVLALGGLLASAWAPALALLAGLAILAGGLVARSALVLKASFLVDLFERFGEAAYRPAGASRGAAAPARAAAA